MSVAVSVVFTGLCALVTGSDRSPAQVLLVDAKGVGEVDGVELPEHAPTLVVSLASLANAETSSPTRVIALGSTALAEQVGLWDLTGSEVRMRVQGGKEAGLQYFQPAPGKSSWPEPPRSLNDPGAWRDLRYLADMRALAGDGRIDRALIDTDEAASSLPHAVSARIRLESGRLEAGIPSAGVHRSDVFEFRGAANEPRLRQALTDTIRWSLESDASAVVIEIVPIAGGPEKRLVLKPSPTTHSLFVSNLPAQNTSAHAHRAVSEEQMAALHFGAYYELLRNKPAERPLPRIWVRPLPRSGTGMMSGPFCPPAVFQRD